MKKVLTAVVLAAVLFMSSNGYAVRPDQIQLPNKGFEEDAALCGWPDHWTQLKGVQGDSDRTFFSEGGKSLLHLQKNLKQLSAEAHAEMNKILTRCKEAGECQPGKELTVEEMLQFSKAMRRIYSTMK